jgi:DNA-binding winged helix-turn-helix (wHTH) protein
MRLRPESFAALLARMACHGGRVVSTDELVSAIWPDVTGREDTLARCAHEVRQAQGPGAAGICCTTWLMGFIS